ncbi:MAG: TIGR02285 family protein [Psychrobium sp.]
MKTLAISLLIATSPASQATQDNGQASIVSWFEFDAPPYYIFQGVKANKGTAQLFQSEIIHQLPQYLHQTQRGNFIRGLKEIENKNNVCATSLLKTPAYEKFMHFSEPWFEVLAIGLNIRHSELNRFLPAIENGKIDFKKLLANTDIKLGILNGRPYGQPIDETLNEYSNTDRVFALTGSTKMHNLLHLFIKRKRFDAVLGYAAETHYYSNQFERDADELLYIPIKDTQLMYKAYVGCSKSSMGKSIITQVNKLIENTSPQLYEKRYLSYLSPQSQETYKLLKQQLAMNN